MPLTPIDVQQKTFVQALRGYEMNEVDDFLDEVVTSLKDLEQRLRDAQERIATLETELTERSDSEGAISRALVSAQRSADAIVAEAKLEADRIRAEATVDADRLTAEAEATRKSLVEAAEQEHGAATSEIERIRGAVTDLKQRLAVVTGMIGTHVAEIDGMIDDANGALGDVQTGDFQPDSSVDDMLSEAAATWSGRSGSEEAGSLHPVGDIGDDMDEALDDPIADLPEEGADPPTVEAVSGEPATDDPEPAESSWDLVDSDDSEDSADSWDDEDDEDDEDEPALAMVDDAADGGQMADINTNTSDWDTGDWESDEPEDGDTTPATSRPWES